MAGKTPKRRRVVKGAHSKSKQRGTKRAAVRAQANGARRTEVAERRQLEASLRESEQRHRSVVAAMAEGVVIQDEQGVILSCNASACQILGLTEAQVLGRTSFDPRWWVIHEDGSSFPGKTHPAMETLRTGLPSEHVIMGVHRPDGTLVWISINTHPITMGKDEFPSGVVSSFRDITEQKRVEENLLRTQFAMDQAVDAVYWIDPHARILYTNEAASAMLGYTKEEFLRMTVHDLNPDFPAEVWPGWWAETKEKKVISLETVHLAKDGRRIPIDIRVSFLAYEGQEFHCAYVHDIRERKRVDEALRASQERFELAARATNDGIWDWNILTGEQYWSDRHLELFGLEAGALTPTYETWILRVHPDDADRVHHATCRHLETREPYDIEMRVRMRDGHYRWFRDQGQAVWDGSGRPVRMVGSISDVTERRNAEAIIQKVHAELEQRVVERTSQLAQANRLLQDEVAERKSVEEAVRDSELRYKLLTEATFDGIAIHDQGILLEVNAGLERMFGYEVGELVGRPLLDLVAEESRERVVANMRDGVSGPYESIGRRKDGTTFPGEVVVRPYRYRGKDVRLVAGRDITERKHLEMERTRQTEELERQVIERTIDIARLESQRVQGERLAALGRLAAGVAHEINNPIAGIKNAFELVKQAVDPAHAQYEFVGMIDREITRVSSIVQNMYQLYRRESGKVETVDLRTMIGDIEALFAKQLQQRQLTLAVEAASKVDRLDAPRSDLLQVLLNLLNNAIDCSYEGGTITMAICEEAEVIRISVADQGAGISLEVLPHIFDPFFTTKTEGEQKGMGLGLSISQSLVASMGGRIDVQTQRGRGSTFSVLLPRRKIVVPVPDQISIIKEEVTHGC